MCITDDTRLPIHAIDRRATHDSELGTRGRRPVGAVAALEVFKARRRSGEARRELEDVRSRIRTRDHRIAIDLEIAIEAHATLEFEHGDMLVSAGCVRPECIDDVEAQVRIERTGQQQVALFRELDRVGISRVGIDRLQPIGGCRKKVAAVPHVRAAAGSHDSVLAVQRHLASQPWNATRHLQLGPQLPTCSLIPLVDRNFLRLEIVGVRRGENRAVAEQVDGPAPVLVVTAAGLPREPIGRPAASSIGFEQQTVPVFAHAVEDALAIDGHVLLKVRARARRRPVDAVEPENGRSGLLAE